MAFGLIVVVVVLVDLSITVSSSLENEVVSLLAKAKNRSHVIVFPMQMIKLAFAAALCADFQPVSAVGLTAE